MFSEYKKAILLRPSAVIWLKQQFNKAEFLANANYTVDTSTDIVLTSTTNADVITVDQTFLSIVKTGTVVGNVQGNNVGVFANGDYICLYCADVETGEYTLWSLVPNYDTNSGELVSLTENVHIETNADFDAYLGLYPTAEKSLSIDGSYTDIALFPLTKRVSITDAGSTTLYYPTFFQTDDILYSRESSLMSHEIVTIGTSNYLRMNHKGSFGDPTVFDGDYFSVWYRIS